ncbi:MAG: amidohydrolase family protein [Pseudomonadales bacterium]
MAQRTLLIRNANIFDGVSEKLISGKDVLTEGGRIARIAKAIPLPEGATLIDAAGRTLTPGFIDMHAHMMFQMSVPAAINADPFYYGYVATKTSDTYLMKGFTTVRDASGNTFSLKKAIDQGIIPGPRIYPSGPMISQTAGHSDHRTDAQVSRLVADEPSTLMKYDMVQIADGRAEVLTAAREALRRGATQIKIAVGGGTGSYADPLDVVQYTEDEIRAAVEAATDWGTYVMAHVYNSDGARRAIANGVKSIEHGNLLDEDTLRLMKKQNVWLSPQVIAFSFYPQGYSDDQKQKHDQAFAGIEKLFAAAKKVGFSNIVFGSDVITDPGKLAEINDEFAFRAQWFTPIEILRQATSKAGELLELSGKRNPYGKVGVIAEGAMADLLLINGNPLEDISILTAPETSLALIVKDGVIYKNRL